VTPDTKKSTCGGRKKAHFPCFQLNLENKDGRSKRRLLRTRSMPITRLLVILIDEFEGQLACILLSPVLSWFMSLAWSVNLRDTKQIVGSFGSAWDGGRDGERAVATPHFRRKCRPKCPLGSACLGLAPGSPPPVPQLQQSKLQLYAELYPGLYRELRKDHASTNDSSMIKPTALHSVEAIQLQKGERGN